MTRNAGSTLAGGYRVSPRQAANTTELPHERIDRVREDLNDLENFYSVVSSPHRYQRLKAFFDDELAALESAPFESLDQDGKIDYLLLKNRLNDQLHQLETDADKDQKVLAFLGGFFPLRIANITEARQRVDDIDAKQAATWLNELVGQVSTVEKGIANKSETAEPTIALRASQTLKDLQSNLQEWYNFYHDYDPLFTWWVASPYPALDKALGSLSNTILKVVLGMDPDDTDTIVGQPIGETALLNALEAEIIPYKPDELIDIGYKEYAWCEAEMKKAASALGYDQWRDALEHVKGLYVPPGQQPTLIRNLTKEAIDYMKKYDLVSVPRVSEEAIRTTMMSPARQKVNPFFLGGDQIIVSYPTSNMSHEDKLMSMRGNNVHFARATVFHELIPGHHLQGHFNYRVRPYRQWFSSAFSTEGWAFYWEMVLWDKESWQKTPENRIGMLFWRMHRCARIIFSLKYHLGEMTAQEAIDLLVNWVGHERATAEGEVRRSVMGDYPPLYQAGYMLGALQLYALRKELVTNGTMGEKQFHDTYLRANQMPVEFFRALVKNEPLERNYQSQWKFYEGSSNATLAGRH